MKLWARSNTSIAKFVLPCFIPLVFSGFAVYGSAQTNGVSAAPVKVLDQGDSVTLENRVVSIRINKANANVLALQYKGMDLVDGSGYWNVYGNTPGGPKTELKSKAMPVDITEDPANNGGEMAEIEINMPYHGQPGAEPLDIAIRYALRRGDSGVIAGRRSLTSPDIPLLTSRSRP